MYVNIKRLPGDRPPEYRVTFHESPDQRPLEHRVHGDSAVLQKFLETKLELDEQRARTIANEADYANGAHFDRVLLTPDEVRLMLRATELEQRKLERAGTIPVP